MLALTIEYRFAFASLLGMINFILIIFTVEQEYKMKIALVLSGCGQFDGSETHEVILTLLSLTQEHIEWDAFAPDIQQSQVFDHFSNEPVPGESRHVLQESARLVRGHIQPLSAADVIQYDAIIIPGGFGAVSNLCNWGEKGVDFSFNSEFEEFMRKAIANHKPIGFICIAPMMITKLYANAKLTIGNDKTIAAQVVELGCEHVNCSATDIVIDEQHQIVSTPANMVAKNIAEVYVGIHKLVQALAAMVD